MNIAEINLMRPYMQGRPAFCNISTPIMVVYVARCRDLQEAEAVQSRLIRISPTLVFSRILTRPSGLDIFNAQMLCSADEQVAVGQVTFGRPANPKDTVWVWRAIGLCVAAMCGLVAAAVIIGAGILAAPAPSMTAMAVLVGSLIVLLSLFGCLSARAAKKITPDRRAFWKAERWLARGLPVVVAGSDLAPDATVKLPHAVTWFVQSTESPLGAAPERLRA